MMILNIFLFLFAFLLCIVLYILFAPLLLEIDSRSNLYRFSVVPVFSIGWVIENLPGHFEMKIFGFRKTLPAKNKSRKAISVKVKTNEQKPSTYKVNYHRIISVIRSFRIKKCLVNFDTGNMPLNGLLFPLMLNLEHATGKNIGINFIGRNELALTIENNAFRMLKAYIFI